MARREDFCADSEVRRRVGPRSYVLLDIFQDTLFFLLCEEYGEDAAKAHDGSGLRWASGQRVGSVNRLTP